MNFEQVNYEKKTHKRGYESRELKDHNEDSMGKQTKDRPFNLVYTGVTGRI